MVSGLQGSFGSTVAREAICTSPKALPVVCLASIPRPAASPTFADGLPAQVVPGVGAATDVEFLGGTAYVLVQFIGSFLGGPDEVNGIYRVDDPNSFTVVADIGAFNVANPPDTEFEAPIGVQTSFQAFRGGFLVTDGHLNRMLRVTLDGDISVVRAIRQHRAGGARNLGKHDLHGRGRSASSPPRGRQDRVVHPGVADGHGRRRRWAAPGRCGAGTWLTTLYGLAQGIWPPGTFAGNPALPNTGQLLRVNGDGTFTVIAGGLNQPSSFEIIKNAAYIVTLGGEIWKVEDMLVTPSLTRRRNGTKGPRHRLSTACRLRAKFPLVTSLLTFEASPVERSALNREAARWLAIVYMSRATPTAISHSDQATYATGVSAAATCQPFSSTAPTNSTRTQSAGHR